MSSVPGVVTLVSLAASIALAGCAAETVRKGGAPSKSSVEYCRPALQAPEFLQSGSPVGAARAVSGTEPAAPTPSDIPDLSDVSAVSDIADVAAEDSGAAVETASFITLDRLFFEFNSYLLTPSARSTLDSIYEKIEGSEGTYTLEGHCDERGDDEYNLALGERRAAAARAYLISRGAPAERLRTISYGREFPADTAGTEEAHQRNRRVEVLDEKAPLPQARYGARE